MTVLLLLVKKNNSIVYNNILEVRRQSMNKLTLDENAKQDWLNIVKKHKKKQKGAPALTTLNTDAAMLKNILRYLIRCLHIQTL